MRKLSFILALLLLFSLSFIACDQAKESEKEPAAEAEVDNNEAAETETPSGDNTLIVRHWGDPMSWNPDSLPDDNGYPIFQNLFNRLVKLDTTKKVIPDLARSWDFSDDGTELTFHLADNATWHDGKPVTAEDVKYTFDYIREQPTYLLNSRLQMVEEITVVDEHTVMFKLSESNASIVADLGWYACFIVPKHIYDNGKPWEENDATLNNPIGSGPFKLGEYKQGESIEIVANDDYFEGRPKLDKVVYAIIPDDATAVEALRNGQIDMLENVPAASSAELLQDPNLRLILNRYPSPIRIIFNMNDPVLKDLAVRRAIATAIDKESISKKVYVGIQEPEYAMYPELIEWVTNKEDTSPHFDLEAAQKILEEAGYEKDADGYYIRGLEIEVFEGGGAPDVAKLIVSTLKEAGIELKVNVSEFNAWADKVGAQHDFMMELQGGFMGPDPAALYSRYGTGTSDNWGSYSNAEFDELCLEAVAETDQAKRAELYRAAQKILAEELPFVPIVGFASYDANNVAFKNLPIDGEGKWGWAEFTYTKKVQ